MNLDSQLDQCNDLMVKNASRLIGCKTTLLTVYKKKNLRYMMAAAKNRRAKTAVFF